MKFIYDIGRYIPDQAQKPWARVSDTLATGVTGGFMFGSNWMKRNEISATSGEFEINDKHDGKAFVMGLRYQKPNNAGYSMYAFGKLYKGYKGKVEHSNTVLDMAIKGEISKVRFLSESEAYPLWTHNVDVERIARTIAEDGRPPRGSEYVAAMLNFDYRVPFSTASEKLKKKAEKYTSVRKDKDGLDMPIITQQLVPSQTITIDGETFNLPKNIYALESIRGVILFGFVKGGKQYIGLATDMLDMPDVMADPQMAKLAKMQARTLRAEVNSMEIAARAIEIKSANNGKT